MLTRRLTPSRQVKSSMSRQILLWKSSNTAFLWLAADNKQKIIFSAVSGDLVSSHVDRRQNKSVATFFLPWCGTVKKVKKKLCRVFQQDALEVSTRHSNVRLIRIKTENKTLEMSHDWHEMIKCSDRIHSDCVESINMDERLACSISQQGVAFDNYLNQKRNKLKMAKSSLSLLLFVAVALL